MHSVCPNVVVDARSLHLDCLPPVCGHLSTNFLGPARLFSRLLFSNLLSITKGQDTLTRAFPRRVTGLHGYWPHKHTSYLLSAHVNLILPELKCEKEDCPLLPLDQLLDQAHNRACEHGSIAPRQKWTHQYTSVPLTIDQKDSGEI